MSSFSASPRRSMPGIAAAPRVRVCGDDDGRIVEVRGRIDDGFRKFRRLIGLENPLPTKMPSAPSCIISAASAGVDTPPAQNSTTGSFLLARNVLHEFERRAEIARAQHEFFFRHRGKDCDLVGDRANVAHGLDDIPAARFTLAANHRRAFGDAPERFTEIARAAHERHVVLVLVDVILIVGRREHFGLIDEVDAERLKRLRLGQVTDANFRHDRDGHGIHDAGDQIEVAHTGDAAVATDVRGDAFERHDGNRAGFLGHDGLFGRDDVHDDAALEHLG